MAQNHFQDGPAAWNYLVAIMRTPVSRLQLREHDKVWDAIDILTDVGVVADATDRHAAVHGSAKQARIHRVQRELQAHAKSRGGSR